MNEADAYSGTMKPQHAVDERKLAEWLRDHVPGFSPPLSVEQFKGGQSNPTYRLRGGDEIFVLRRKPPGPLLPSAHAVDREFRVLAALADTDVPVPRVFALCEDDAVIGSAFYVMQHVGGRVFWDPRLPELPREDRTALFASMNATIAALHRVDPAAVGLSEFIRSGSFLNRQISRWSKQYRASETESIPAFDRLLEWLPRHVPAEMETRIVHGDYRLDNLIIHPDRPEVAAILDWELWTLGDPLADFANHAMVWRIPPDLFRGLSWIDHAAFGIPTEEAYLAEYCARTGRDRVENWDFYIAFSIFRLAAILQGIAKRALDGTASNANAVEVGRKARPLAERAWEIARSIGD